MSSAESAGLFRVTRWVTDAMSWRERQGFAGGEQSANSEIVAEHFADAGAYVMGRRAGPRRRRWQERRRSRPARPGGRAWTGPRRNVLTASHRLVAMTFTGRPDDDPALARFSPAPPTPRSRTAKVWIAAIVLAFFGIIGLLLAALLLSEANSDADHGRDVAGFVYGLIYAQFAISTLQVASGVALWLGKRWAIGLATAICCINILGNILSFFAGAVIQAVLGLVVNVSLIRTIRSDEVAEWCRVP